MLCIEIETRMHGNHSNVTWPADATVVVYQPNIVHQLPVCFLGTQYCFVFVTTALVITSD